MNRKSEIVDNLVYGRDYGHVIKPRSKLNGKLERIMGKKFGIPCEVEIFAEVLKRSDKEPEFNQVTVITPAKYIDRIQESNFYEEFEQRGFVNVKYVSKEGYVAYVPD
ncbi:MAG: hypothetical protein WD876_02905 [Candidatus Pacearchaeota archaeon]